MKSANSSKNIISSSSNVVLLVESFIYSSSKINFSVKIFIKINERLYDAQTKWDSDSNFLEILSVIVIQQHSYFCFSLLFHLIRKHSQIFFSTNKNAFFSPINHFLLLFLSKYRVYSRMNQ